MWGYESKTYSYMKTFWPNCVSRKSRKLDEIHISYKVEKPVLVAMLTHWTPRSFLVWFHAFKNKSDTYGILLYFHEYFHPWLFLAAKTQFIKFFWWCSLNEGLDHFKSGYMPLEINLILMVYRTVFPQIFPPLIIFHGQLFNIFLHLPHSKKSNFFCVLYYEEHQVVSKFLQVYQLLA